MFGKNKLSICLRCQGTPNDNIASSLFKRQAFQKNEEKDNSVENLANAFQKYIVYKIGSAPLENGLDRKTNTQPNSSHLCVSEFYLSGLVCFLHSV